MKRTILKRAQWLVDHRNGGTLGRRLKSNCRTQKTAMRRIKRGIW